jgi:hypothetical protein
MKTRQKRSKNGLLLGYLEKVSWKLLDEYPDVVKAMIRGKSGIYALYRDDKLYYVGLATNLKSRINAHLKDRHSGLWNRFSVYATRQDDHIRELESLVLRITRPKGNRVVGRPRAAQNLARAVLRTMVERDADKRASLLGGRFARMRRRAKAAESAGTVVLAGLVEKRLRLRASYKGATYIATLRRDGRIQFKGVFYDSPTAAAKVAAGRSIMGWTFWKYKNPEGKWVRLRELKR